MVKGILFDLEGIAVRAAADPGPFLEEVRALGHDVHERGFRAACECALYVDYPERGHQSAEQLLEAILKHLKLKPKRTEIMSLAPVFADLFRMTLREDAARTIPAVAKGRRVGVLAALPRFLVAPVLAPIATHVAAVVTPNEAKAVPPCPKAFKAALAALKLKAKDVAFVSPSCPDLTVAKSLGLRTVFLRRHGDAECADAATTIRSLEELEDALAPTATVEVLSPAASSEAPVAVGPGR